MRPPVWTNHSILRHTPHSYHFSKLGLAYPPPQDTCVKAYHPLDREHWYLLVSFWPPEIPKQWTTPKISWEDMTFYLNMTHSVGRNLETSMSSLNMPLTDSIARQQQTQIDMTQAPFINQTQQEWANNALIDDIPPSITNHWASFWVSP